MQIKKSLIFSLFLLFVLGLSACTIPSNAQPTVTDEEMSTRIAKILTEMVTPTSDIPTAELPALPTDTPQPVVEPTEVPIVDQTSPTAAPPTTEPTQAPTQAATEAPYPAPSEAAAATATANPTATAIPATPTAGLTQVPSYTPPPSDPRAKLGDPDWTDSMDNGNFWPTGPDTYTNIDFSDGKMLLTGNTTTDGWRLASAGSLNNFYLEMKVSTDKCSADDRYGFMFRVPVLHEANKGYLFGITCDGKYSLREWDATIGDKGQMTNHVYWQEHSAIQTGANKTNTIGIMAVGDRLIMYVNGVLLKEIKDDTFTSGYFGLFVGARQTEDFTIKVDEMSYWENPTP